MKRYSSHIVLLCLVLLCAGVIVHKIYEKRSRVVKYGNPANERLVRECRYYKTDQDCLTVKLYEGRDVSRGTSWYSVTFEKPGSTETQILVSAGNPGIESIGLCEKEIRLMCGKGCINIPVENVDERFRVPLIYYNGKEIGESGLSDKI